MHQLHAQLHSAAVALVCVPTHTLPALPLPVAPPPQVPSGNVLVLLAHNGPAGLGAAPHSICGCDWLATAGDHGDPDLQTVLGQLQAAGRRVALVLHGHMHHMIKGEAHTVCLCHTQCRHGLPWYVHTSQRDAHALLTLPLVHAQQHCNRKRCSARPSCAQLTVLRAAVAGAASRGRVPPDGSHRPCHWHCVHQCRHSAPCHTSATQRW
jgi:hypothetical protein